jgi:DNA-binding CsgD family transcriptional regulator
LLIRGSDTLLLKQNTKYLLFDYIGFYHDTSNSLDIHEVTNICHSGHFIASNKIPSKLFSRNTYWLHFIVKNQTRDSHSWMFHASAAISHIELFTLTEKKEETAIDTLKTVQESVNNYHKMKFVCNADPDEVTEYYVKIRQEGAIEYDIDNCYLTPQSSYLSEIITQSVFTGLIVGIMLLIMMYNLFMYVNKLKKVYVIYVIYIVFSITFVVHGSYLVEYVLLPINQYKLNWLYMALPVGHIFYIWFIREFIEPANIPKKIDNRLYKPFIAIVIVSNIVLGYLALTDNYRFIALYYQIPALYASLGLLLAILLMIYVRRPEAKYALIGNSITIVSGIVSLLLDNTDWLENNHVYNAGMLADIIFFTYTLSLKKKREEDQARQSEMQLSMVKIMLESKRRELTQKALHITQQEEILLNIKEQLIDIKGEKAQTNEVVLNVLSDVDFYLKQNSWDDFEKYFTEVHPDFYNKLKSIYPGLTQNEIRICAMLKLNLNTKQIADISRKTPKSIEVARTRIRQKIRLSRDENLFDKLSML